MKKAPRLLFLASLASVMGCSTAKSQASYRTLYVYCFDSTTKITYSTAVDYDDQLTSLLQTISEVADPYSIPSSGATTLYTVNQSSETPIEVGDDLKNLLSSSLDLMSKTDGYYSPYVGTLTRIWKYYLFGGLDPVEGYEAKVPSDSLIEQALEVTAGTSIELDGNFVTKHGRAELDLGAIAKGYALDRVIAFFQEKGITQYVINAGNSSLGIGKSSKGGSITVDLQYVKDPYCVKVQDATTAVSGIYEQYAVVDGVTYSHVVNPKTGKALPEHSLVFLEAGRGEVSDALSTAVLCMPLQKAKSLESAMNVKFAVFDNEGEPGSTNPVLQYETEGFRS